MGMAVFEVVISLATARFRKVVIFLVIVLKILVVSVVFVLVSLMPILVGLVVVALGLAVVVIGPHNHRNHQGRAQQEPAQVTMHIVLSSSLSPNQSASGSERTRTGGCPRDCTLRLRSACLREN